MTIETVTRQHASQMLKQPKTAVRRDTIQRLKEIGTEVEMILRRMPVSGPVLHSKEVAINTRVYALLRDLKSLQTLVGTLERE